MASQESIAAWMEAAGVAEGGGAERIVVRVGEFLEQFGQMPSDEARGCLAGIDFSLPVTVVRLPDSVYVRYTEVYNGVWYTDTGLTAEQATRLRGRCRRELYVPLGVVPALRLTARSFCDDWNVGRHLVVEHARPGVAVQTGGSGGAGLQYLVNQSRMMRRL